METKNKQEYIDAWDSHISSMFSLCFTPSEELSKEVSETLYKLKRLVVKVAEDKNLK